MSKCLYIQLYILTRSCWQCKRCEILSMYFVCLMLGGDTYSNSYIKVRLITCMQIHYMRGTRVAWGRTPLKNSNVLKWHSKVTDNGYWIKPPNPSIDKKILWTPTPGKKSVFHACTMHHFWLKYYYNRHIAIFFSFELGQ